VSEANDIEKAWEKWVREDLVVAFCEPERADEMVSLRAGQIPFQAGWKAREESDVPRSGVLVPSKKLKEMQDELQQNKLNLDLLRSENQCLIKELDALSK